MFTKVRAAASVSLLTLVAILLLSAIAVPTAVAASPQNDAGQTADLGTAARTAVFTLAAMLLVGAVVVPGGAYRSGDKWVDANGKAIDDPSPYLAEYQKLVRQGLAPAQAFEQARQSATEKAQKPVAKPQSDTGKKGKDKPGSSGEGAERGADGDGKGEGGDAQN